MAVNELAFSHHSPPMPPLRKHVPHWLSSANNSNLGYNTATNKVLDCGQSLPKANHFSTKDPSRFEISSSPLPRLPGSQAATTASLHNLKSSVIKNDCSPGFQSLSFKELDLGSCGDELPKFAPSQARGMLALHDNFTTPANLMKLNKNEPRYDIDAPTENFIREMQRPKVLELVRKYNPYPSSHLNYNRDPSLWKNLTEEEYKEKMIYNQRVETHYQRLMSEDKLSPATAYVLGNIITQLELQAKICEETDTESVETSSSYRQPFTINPDSSNHIKKNIRGEIPPLKESKHKRSESIILNNYSDNLSANQGKSPSNCSRSSRHIKGQSSSESGDLMVEASELGTQLWRSQMEHKWCHSNQSLRNSEHMSRLDPQAYQSYAAGILHSSKRSEKFLRLQKCFTILNRIAKIEKQYNITGEVLKKSGYSNVPQRVRQVLKQLYTELDEAQSKNEFFFSPKKSKRWSADTDYELRLQQKSLKDRCAIYDLSQKPLNAGGKQKPALLYDIKRELSFDELFAKYQDLDRELIREKMSHATSLPNLGQENRKSTPPPGAYLQIQETCNKLSKVRAIHGTHIDEVNNLYEIHVKHSPDGSIDMPSLHIRSESAPYHNDEGKWSSVLQRSDSCKESFFNFSTEDCSKETGLKKTAATPVFSSQPPKVPLPPYMSLHSMEKRSEPQVDKDEVKEDLVVKSIRNKSKDNQGSYFMKDLEKNPLEGKVDGFYNSNDRYSSLNSESKASRFKNLSLSSDSSGNSSSTFYSKTNKPVLNTSISQHITPQPYRSPVSSAEEPVVTKPVFQVRDVKSFVAKDNEFAQGPYFEVSKSRAPSPASSSLSAAHHLELTQSFTQNTRTKELVNNFPPLNSKNAISLNDISSESLEKSQLLKSLSMPFIALSQSGDENINNNINKQKRPISYAFYKNTEKRDSIPSKTSCSDIINSDLSRSYHSFQTRIDHECEGYKPPKEILNDMLHVVDGYNVLVDGEPCIKRVEKEMAIKYLDNLGQEWKESQRNNLRGQDSLNSNEGAKPSTKETRLQEPAKIKNTIPYKNKWSRDQVPPPPPPPPPPPKPQSSPHLPRLKKSLPTSLPPSLHDYKPLDCSTPTLLASSGPSYPVYPGTGQTPVPGQIPSVGLPNASQGYMFRSQNAIEDGPWEMTSRMTTATPNGLETATNTHQPPANTGD